MFVSIAFIAFMSELEYLPYISNYDCNSSAFKTEWILSDCIGHSYMTLLW